MFNQVWVIFDLAENACKIYEIIFRITDKPTEPQ